MRKIIYLTLTISIFFQNCYSLSNYKTAKVLGYNDNGQPELSGSASLSTVFNDLGGNLLLLPELSLRYPLIPGKLEMGNKLMITGFPVIWDNSAGIAGGVCLEIDGKLKIFSKKNFTVSIDLGLESGDISNSVPFGANASSLLTYELSDSFSITLNPKIKYWSFHDNSYLFSGGSITLDVGNTFGIMPEFGIYYVFLLPGSAYTDEYLNYTFGFSTRLIGALPWAKKKSDTKKTQ
jgi:hypothetical protein